MNNNKLAKLYFALNVALIASIMLMDIFLCFAFRKLIFKSIAAVLTSVLAVTNLIISIKIYKKRKLLPNILICIGVVIGAIADIMMNINFVAGGVLFALGHILYLIALYQISKFKLKELFIIVLAVIISIVIIFVPYVDFGDFAILIVLYAIILSLMFAKCINAYLFNAKKSPLYAILAIAGFLFYLSDMMLLFGYFKSSGADSIIFDKICLMLYYPAQIMFAVSILFPIRKLKKQKNKTE